MARIFNKKEGTIEFKASQQGKLALSRNYHMQTLFLRLEVTHTNASAVFKDEDLFSLINTVSVIANGSDNIKQIPFNKLYLDNIIYTGRKGLNNIETTDGSDKKSFVNAMLHFSAPNMIRPHDTILNTAHFNTFDLVVDWGSSATLGTGITVTDATLKVDSSCLIQYSRNAGEVVKYYKETSLFEEITASSNEKQITLPINKEYKTISLVQTLDGARTDTIINRVTLKSGTTVFIDMDWDTLRAWNDFSYNPQETNHLLGIGILDFTTRGRFSDMLNTLKDFNSLELVLDVTKQDGENKVFVYSDTIHQTNIIEVKK